MIVLLPAKGITSFHPLSTLPSLLHFQKKHTVPCIGILNASDRHLTRLEARRHGTGRAMNDLSQDSVLRASSSI